MEVQLMTGLSWELQTEYEGSVSQSSLLYQVSSPFKSLHSVLWKDRKEAHSPSLTYGKYISGNI